MKSKFAAAALIAMIVAPTAMPTEASARHRHRHHTTSRVHHYRTPTGQYRCSGGNGAVGTVAGGVGGALIGNAIGGDALGTIAGGVGGALLGRHLDKVNTRHRNGC